MHHHFVFGFFPWFGFIFFICFVFFIVNMILWRRRNGGLCFSVKETHSALEMLEKRYVSGEINEEDFKKMRENLIR